MEQEIMQLLYDAVFAFYENERQELNNKDAELVKKKIIKKIIDNTKKHSQDEYDEKIKKLLEKSSEEFWGI